MKVLEKERAEYKSFFGHKYGGANVNSKAFSSFI